MILEVETQHAVSLQNSPLLQFQTKAYLETS